jgi:RNA polymerase sigma-70 factor, ECF subfamily
VSGQRTLEGKRYAVAMSTSTETAAARDATSIDPRLEQYRAALTGYCYRMLGSPFEAEDAVQETFVRAWRHLERSDDVRSLRTWVFTIATNVCMSMLRSPQRRARAMDMGPASYAGASFGASLPESAWVQPMPDSRVLPTDGDPAEVAAQRETIRLAFVAALQHLPPKQRAVLLLRDVLVWKADEVARLLDTTVAAVNSALQRARATLETHNHSATTPPSPQDVQQDLLLRYIDAFERHDIDTLVSLLHEDATTSMPPLPWWLRGRDEIIRTITAPDPGCQGARRLPTFANGGPAFGQYLPTGPDGRYEAHALVVFDESNGLITDSTNFLDDRRLFPLFGLPTTLEAAAVSSTQRG